MTPTTNTSQGVALAQAGQLDQDLPFFSTGYFEGLILLADPASAIADTNFAASL